jgi:hypothetical protein
MKDRRRTNRNIAKQKVRNRQESWEIFVSTKEKYVHGRQRFVDNIVKVQTQRKQSSNKHCYKWTMSEFLQIALIQPEPNSKSTSTKGDEIQ